MSIRKILISNSYKKVILNLILYYAYFWYGIFMDIKEFPRQLFTFVLHLKCISHKSTNDIVIFKIIILRVPSNLDIVSQTHRSSRI